MNKRVYGLDNDGNEVSITLASDCIIFIDGIDPQQEHQIKIFATNGENEITDFIGERPKREER